MPQEDVYATRKKIIFVLEQLKIYAHQTPNPIKVLDFGCGNAADMGQFIIREGYDYCGLDIHEPSLTYAKTQFAAPHARFCTEIGPDEKFDVLILSEVLEHLTTPHEILSDLVHKHLNKGGIVIGSVPNGYGLTEIEKFINQRLGLYVAIRGIVRAIRFILGRPIQPNSPGKNADGLPYNHASGHVQFYTKPALRRVAQSAGLDYAAFQNGSLMGADLSGVTIFRIKPLIKLNTWIAKFLPAWAAATWHFVFKPTGN
ncbi:class I SAM-dependent methyltransferase [Kiloniella majae]|uniref:class I SAM-dependent methyltransferase n=1 Tax=Kiloniella majae TaxID=1938558 RepID=UPI0015C519B5|nr:class I SAM-dependent methyltransferase [Kiloniella majae]